MNRNQSSQGQRRASVLTEAVESTEGSSQLDSFGKINRCIVDCSLQKANSKEPNATDQSRIQLTEKPSHRRFQTDPPEKN